MISKSAFKTQAILYIVILVVLSVYLISPFIVSILLAGSVSLALYPFQRKLVSRGLKEKYSALLLTVFFTVVISIPFVFFIAKGTVLVTEQLREFALGEKLKDEGMQAMVDTFKNDIVDRILRVLDQFQVGPVLSEEKLSSYFKSINEFLLNFFQNFVTEIPTLVLFFIVMIFSSYSFLKGGRGVRKLFQSVFGFNQKTMDELVGVYIRNARQVYFSNIITGISQSILIATGVYFVTSTDWFLVFFVTLILSFIPVIGAAPVGVLFAIMTFFQGNTTGAIILIILSVVTGIVDNLLRPWLASFGQTNTPAMVSFVFVIGGALMLGFPGLFLGLLLGSMVYDTLPIFWHEITKSELFSRRPKFISKDKGEESQELPLN